jgi:hypothetical protein
MKAELSMLSSNSPLSFEEAAELYRMPLCVLQTAVDRNDVTYEDLGGTIVLTKDYMDELLLHPDIGVVYAVGFLKYVKIGFSTNFASRLETLQGGCPLRLTVYRTFPAFQHDERAFHRRFAHARLSGEWFLMDRKVAAWARGQAQ